MIMTAVANAYLVLYGASAAPAFDILGALRRFFRKLADEIGAIVKPLLAAKSDYFESAILNWFRGTTFPTAPANVYLALFTDATNDTSGGTEVAGNNYSRTAIPVATGSWTAPGAGGSISNAIAIISATASGSWGTVTHCAIYDAVSGGNRLYHGALTGSVAITTGQAFYAPIGSLVLTEA